MLKSFITISIITLSSICFAGNETGGAGIVQLFNRAEIVDGNILNFETLDGIYSYKMSAVQFIESAPNGILFKAQSIDGEKLFFSKEDVLETDTPELINLLEKSFKENKSWVNF